MLRYSPGGDHANGEVTLFHVSGDGLNGDVPPFLEAWVLEPQLIIGLLIPLALYAFGWYRLQRRGPRGLILPKWRAWAFVGGIAALALALISPISGYSEVQFSMHMTQHLMLLMIAPPLLLLGAPLIPTLWALPGSARRWVGQFLSPRHPMHRVFSSLAHPFVAVAAYVSTIAVWHLPGLYDVAQGQTIIHDLQHMSFLGVATLYWWPLVHPTGGRRQLSYALAIPYLLPPFIEGMVIGALVTLSSRPLYATYQGTPDVWGVSTLEDQQIAGLIMWVPGGLMLLIPLFWLLWLALNAEEKRLSRGVPSTRSDEAEAD